jgi:hypothetical protein
VIELRKIENMRFRQYGRGNIQQLTNIRQVVVKMGIRQLFGVFIYDLFTDFSFRHQFSPNSHSGIIHENGKKVNCLQGVESIFLRKAHNGVSVGIR